VDFSPHLVDLKKISWILQKSRGFEKNPVDFAPYQYLLIFPGKNDLQKKILIQKSCAFF
jgi:hypothetical protein